MTDMAQLAMILGAVSLFVGVFATWYTLWHRRAATCFEAVAMTGRRAVHVVRPGADADLDRRRTG
jgi:hypothetical protein